MSPDPAAWDGGDPPPLLVDRFDRPGPDVGAGWSDFHSTDGLTAHFDRPALRDGALAPASDGSAHGGRFTLYRDTGSPAADVRLRWSARTGGEQPGPAVLVDPGGDPLKGMSYYWNLVWRAFFLVGITDDYEDRVIHDAFPIPAHFATGGEMRLVTDGSLVAGYFDDELVIGPVPVPPSLRRATAHGVYLAQASPEHGIVDRVELRSFAGALARYRPPRIAGRATVAEADAATEVVVDLPDAARPGDRLVALLAFGGGGSVEPEDLPPGWHRSAIDGVDQSLRHVVAFRTVDGTEGPTVTFPIGGGPATWVAAVVVPVADAYSGSRPERSVVSASASSSTPSPSVGVDGASMHGPERLWLWATVVVGGARVTPPVGWDGVAEVGGHRQRLVVAARVLDFVPSSAPSCGPQRGVVEVPSVSTSSLTEVFPDPHRTVASAPASRSDAPGGGPALGSADG